MSANSSSLRPGWYKGADGQGGRGFQPPPSVLSASDEQRDKARSSSWGSQGERSTSSGNKFAALDDDFDDAQLKEDKPASTNARSEAFRSSFRSASTGSKSGRSLADLAARAPEGSPAAVAAAGGPPGGGRRHSAYSNSTGDVRTDQRRAGAYAGSFRSSDGALASDSYKPDAKVIRFTREKILSMRPAPKADTPLPEALHGLEGTAIVSLQPLDPVCWDTFDSEEIWAAVPRERSLSIGEKTQEARPVVREEPRRRTNHNAPSGRWQRGVALPPPDEAGGARRKERESDNPDDLWDDPIGGSSGAAADFSAFGAMPTDADADEVFDFEKIAEASLKLEEELRGPKPASEHKEETPPQNGVGEEDDDDEDDDDAANKRKIDSTRPLTSVGTTIASGSGDNVNVFEDFDVPSKNAEKESSVRGGGEDPSASSRLMKMIGVTKPESAAGAPGAPSSNPWGSSGEPAPDGGAATTVPLNPWGDPITTGAPASQPAVQSTTTGLDLAARLEAFASEQKVRETQEAEIVRRRQQQGEDNQRRAAAQRQAEQRAQQAAAIQQQQPQPQQSNQHSQLELVLMERICAILENAWGRSDLGSILSRLHSEDSRVIPLLNSVDALRALIARSPERVALRSDASFAGEMAVLLLTNSQWQQQQSQGPTRAQQEEVERRRLEEKAAARVRTEAPKSMPGIKPGLPWYYSDPKQNIQGPFRNEEMRQWFEAGYFQGDLPISQEKTGPFLKLSTLFRDLSKAFKSEDDTASNDASSKAKLQAEAEELERRRMQEEQDRKSAASAAKAAESQAREAAKREQREREEAKRRTRQKAEEAAAKAAAAAEAEKTNNGGNDSSNKLKMLLGLSSTGPAEPHPINGEHHGATQKQQAPSKKSEKKKGNKKPQQRASENTAAASNEPEPGYESAKPQPAWGGVGTSKPKKTMSEIQQEEARTAATMATHRDRTGATPPSSGWANVAATGKAGWSSGALRTASAKAQATPATSAASRPAQARGGGTQPASNVVRGADSSQGRSVNNVSSTPAEEFGTTISLVLEKWCKEQMQKINGSEDLTLIAFCMTLNDASEIRQYLTTYLGTTPQVNNFATEFIAKRGLGAPQQEQWETPGSAKKGRKKKGGR